MSGLDFVMGNDIAGGTADYEYAEAHVLEIIREIKNPRLKSHKAFKTKA